MLHAGWRERIRILRAMLRSGLLGGISGRDEEIAAALRVCARYRDLHGALDIAASAGLEVEGMADAIRLGLPEAGWSVMLRPIGPKGEAVPEVDLRVERSAAPDPALSDGRHASGAVTDAVSALALKRRALARLAGGSEGDTALPAPGFVWTILERISAREVVVVRAGEILEVFEGGVHRGMALARLEAARRTLKEGRTWPGARGRGLRTDGRLGELTRRAAYDLCSLALASAGSGRGRGSVQRVSGSRALTVQVVPGRSKVILSAFPGFCPRVAVITWSRSRMDSSLRGSPGRSARSSVWCCSEKAAPFCGSPGKTLGARRGRVPALATARRMRFMARGPLDGRGACSAAGFSGHGTFGP